LQSFCIFREPKAISIIDSFVILVYLIGKRKQAKRMQFGAECEAGAQTFGQRQKKPIGAVEALRDGVNADPEVQRLPAEKCSAG
jgi:hypothetical protein